MQDEEKNNEELNKPNEPKPRGVKSVGKTPEFSKEDTEWWNKNTSQGKAMGRREANTAIALIAGGVIVGGIVLASIVDSDEEEGPDEDEIELQQDAHSLQVKEGWDVGAKTPGLTYPAASLVDNDYAASLDWKNYLNLDKALATFKPTRADLQPFFVPTLLSSLSQKKMLNSISLFFTPAMGEAYSRGLGLKEILQKNKSNDALAIIVDMPGEQSVAFAAALANVSVPVVTFDNWPHPMGVVPAHLTLSSMLYYAGEFEKAAAQRKNSQIPLFVLDRKRFVANVKEDTEFDNRYIAKLPLIDDFKKMGVTNIMYCVLNEKTELDDINDDFVSYQNAGININMINLADFKLNPTTDSLGSKMNIQNRDSLDKLRENYRQAPPVYHYGGGPTFIPVFFGYHPYMSYGRSVTVVRNIPSGLSAPAYRPIARPTVFSSRSTGGVGAGVGKIRPSGFGKISTRVSRSSGRMTGVRTGRMGSFGRVGGRGG